jgi:hypothetical protein
MKRGENSKGQITIFIIIAILVVAVIVLFFIFRDKLTVKGNSSEVIVSPIYTKALYCLDSTTQEGIKYIALQGGYNKIPVENSLIYFADEVPDYYISGKKSMPSMERVERELGNYIQENLDSCINLSNFEEQGFYITKGNLTVSTVVSENKISINAIYPLSIKKGEETSVLREFDTSINSNFKELYSASEEVLNLYYEKPGLLCLTCLDTVSKKYDLEVKATPLADKNVIWFSVSDSQTELNWRFVVQQ